jgi:hypothetical protein
MPCARGDGRRWEVVDFYYEAFSPDQSTAAYSPHSTVASRSLPRKLHLEVALRTTAPSHSPCRAIHARYVFAAKREGLRSFKLTDARA